MRENLKKPLLFAVIVIVGSILVLFDIPLLLLIPLVILVGFATLLALGSITVAEIRGSIAGLGRSGILKRLNDIKFFEKTPAGKPVPKAATVKEAPKARADKEAKPGLVSHISSFFTSLGSLGSVLQQRKGQEKKVEDINKLLDKTVREKVTVPPPAAGAPALPGTGSAAAAKTLDMDDPFMSLSGDEFDEGLLEGLDDDGGLAAAPPAPGAGPGTPEPSAGAAGPDLPPPTLDIDAAAGDILKGAGGDLEEFSGLESGDLNDEDFGDLDSLSLDDIELEGEADTGAAPASVPDSPPSEMPAPSPAPAADSGAVKTAWIPSDAPKDAGEQQDEIATQADMAAFAGGSGGDEDLLSSIASDVKHVKKEQDLSLLRELRDFRAEAAEIETELTGVFERMNQPQLARKKNPPATKGIK
jgi:hypothetical protein